LILLFNLCAAEIFVRKNRAIFEKLINFWLSKYIHQKSNQTDFKIYGRKGSFVIVL
jgi:hypothetical protein